MKKFVIAAAMMAAMASSAFAAESGAANVVVYGVAGTGGAGIGAGFQPMKDVVLRAEIAKYTKSYTKDETDLSYTGDLKLSTQAIYADYHLFGGGFRLTGGVEFGGPKAQLMGKPNNGMSYTLNGNTYAVGADDKITASIKYPSAMPYVGIGWGLGDFNKSGFRMGVDLGANIGKPKANVAATGVLTSLPGFEADLAAENQKLNDDVRSVKAFPVLKLSIGYAF
jgi:opacity protein-like surface antigen